MKRIASLSLVIMFLAISSRPAWTQIDYNQVDYGVHPMQYSPVGTTGWQFLKISTNARSASMGGVTAAWSHGDANSAFTNPASLADVLQMDFAFSQMNWVADIGYQSASAVKSLGKWGVIGLNMIYVDYGEELRTENVEFVVDGKVTVAPSFENLGTFGASDMAVGLSYAQQITNKLQVGGTLRYLEERIDDAKTRNWSLDIGTLFYTGFKTFRISMLGKSFGPDAEFREYEDRIERTPFRIKMPMLLTLGAAIDIIEDKANGLHRMVLAAEYIIPNDGRKKINIGTEYTFMDLFSIRAGYKVRYDEEGLTLGGGLNYKITGLKIRLDYAYMDVGLFNQFHMFTVGFSMEKN